MRQHVLLAITDQVIFFAEQTANVNIKSLQTTISTLTSEKEEILMKFHEIEKEIRQTKVRYGWIVVDSY